MKIIFLIISILAITVLTDDNNPFPPSSFFNPNDNKQNAHHLDILQGQADKKRDDQEKANQTPNQNLPKMDKPPKSLNDMTNKSDETLKKIRDFIYLYAKNNCGNPSNTIKNKLAGVLPDGYDIHLRRAGAFFREDKERISQFMYAPFEEFKQCIFPTFPVSYKKFCRSLYPNSKVQLMACQNIHCKVCCDNLAEIYSRTASSTEIGKNLGLADEKGMKDIKKVINNNLINNCRDKCRVIDSSRNSFNLKFQCFKDPQKDKITLVLLKIQVQLAMI